MNIAVMVSGNGTNLQAIIDAIKNETLNATIKLVISNKPDILALRRAYKNLIPVLIVPRTNSNTILSALKVADVDLIVLAGYNSILPTDIINVYRKRIINVHPSLLPKFGGKGFFGDKIHQMIIDAGETTTGATIHYVDEGVDTGEIIIQSKISTWGETATSLAQKVRELEHHILIEAIKIIIEKE